MHPSRLQFFPSHAPTRDGVEKKNLFRYAVTCENMCTRVLTFMIFQTSLNHICRHYYYYPFLLCSAIHFTACIIIYCCRFYLIFAHHPLPLPFHPLQSLSRIYIKYRFNFYCLSTTNEFNF
jgi:hypothetical protein